LLGDDKEGGTGKGFVITFADEAPAKSKPQVLTVKRVQTKVVPVLYFNLKLLSFKLQQIGLKNI
jgi:hypothetical protein